jgi:hypothetical protein
MLSLAACAGLVSNSGAATVSLGTAASFGVLAGSTITNTGATVINGDIGLAPGTSITGFPPGSVTGTTHVANGVAVQAKADALTAYNGLAGMAPTQSLTGTNLGGLTLTPGVYFFSSAAELTGRLTLDGLGQAQPIFIFQIGTALTTSSNASIIGVNGVTSCDIFFQVGSSATLGTDTAFLGTILALQSVTLNTRAVTNGGVIALNGAVTLDTNNVSACIPEPASGALAVLGASLLCIRRKRRSIG